MEWYKIVYMCSVGSMSRVTTIPVPTKRSFEQAIVAAIIVELKTIGRTLCSRCKGAV